MNHHCDSTFFIESFDLRLQELNRNNVDAYLMGDFNLNLLNYGNDDKVKSFVDLI